MTAELTLGPVHLVVSDLDRSLDYYESVIGLSARALKDGVAWLGADGRDLVALHEEPGAQPVKGHAGLFHYALLVPERAALGRWLAHAKADGVTLTGASDHIASEALYLRDPDGHGIEIYADRPREKWRGPDGSFLLTSDPLDMRDLLAAGGGEAEVALPPGTVMGHVHLHVADLDATEAFYGGVLGLDKTAEIPGQATFLSAGGYHHHVAGNLWAGRGASPPPPGSAALRHFEWVLPTAAERDRLVAAVADAGGEPAPVADGVLVRDPSQNALVLRSR